jgi:hypothetical protein
MSLRSLDSGTQRTSDSAEPLASDPGVLRVRAATLPCT